jgi:hypothetical protein
MERRMSVKGGHNSDTSSSSARVIKDLPKRRRINTSGYIGEGDGDDEIDWYTLFKVSRNWQTGNYTSRQLQILHEKAREPFEALIGSDQAPISSSRNTDEEQKTPQTLVDSTKTHIFTTSHTSNDTDDAPTILVFPSASRNEPHSSIESSQESLCKYQSPNMGSKKHRNLFITSLAVDRKGRVGDSVRLFVGYSSGDSELLYFNTETNSVCHEQLIHGSSHEPIVSVALYSPLLVTCTIDFRIRIYQTSGDTPQLLEERRTYSCHWPATLRLEPLAGMQEDEPFRLSIAYSSPVYPIGWTVGLQEIIITSRLTFSSRSASARQSHVVTRIDSSSKNNRNKGITGVATTGAERRNEVGSFTSLSYEDPFIVVGTKDNDVICFKVAGTTKCIDSLPLLLPLTITHVCAFQGHTGTVHSVSLNEGRCVTGGSDGSVRIWKLGDEEHAVAKAAGLLTTIDASLRKGLGKVVTIGSSLALGKRKRSEAGPETSSSSSSNLPLTLAEILLEAQDASRGRGRAGSASSSAVVRWVTSAFDQIISVSAIKSVPSTSINCRMEANGTEREEEQVQIWNFSH